MLKLKSSTINFESTTTTLSLIPWNYVPPAVLYFIFRILHSHVVVVSAVAARFVHTHTHTHTHGLKIRLSCNNCVHLLRKEDTSSLSILLFIFSFLFFALSFPPFPSDLFRPGVRLDYYFDGALSLSLSLSLSLCR